MKRRKALKSANKSKTTLLKKKFFLRCVQVTLRSHLVENFGLSRFQTVKNTGERREQCMQQQRDTLLNNSCTILGLINVPTFYLPCIHQMSKFPEDMVRFGGVSYAIEMLPFKYRE